MNRFLKAIFVLSWFLISQVTSANVVLQTNSSGQLTGATGLVVAGLNYDVEFKSGSCNSVFSNCDQNTFAFHDGDVALAAARVLLDSIFNVGQYDDDNSLTAGCTSNSWVCEIYVPYIVDTDSVYIGVTQNWRTEPGTSDNAYTSYISRDFADSAIIFAVWTPQEVPEPGSLALIVVGLAGLRASRRKQKSA